MLKRLQRYGWPAWLLPGLVFAFLASATIATWRWQTEIQRTSNIEESNRASAAYTADIAERLQLHAQFLRSVQAFATAHPEIERKAWQTFATEVDAPTNLPGIYSFSYAPLVAAGDKPDFVRQLRATTKNRAARIFPTSQREIAFPIALIFPEGRTQKTALGFDMYSEAIRQQAIDTAISSRNVSLSGPIVLISERSKRLGFLLIKAVYRNNLPLGNVTERRRALSGIVVAAYRVDEFIDALSRSQDNRFIVQIFDGGGSERPIAAPALEPIYNADPQWQAPAKAQPLHHEIHFGGRNWIIHFYPRNTASVTAFDTPTLVLTSGLILSALLSLLVFHLSTHRARAERYALELTSELRQSEERFRLAAAGTNDGLWDQNLQTGEEYLSPRMREIYGFTCDDGPRSVIDYIRCVHPDDEERRMTGIRQHFHKNTPLDVVVRINKAGGELAWVRIRGEAVRDTKGQVIRLAGSVSDVTQLHLAEQELRAHRDHLQALVDQRTARLEGALHQAHIANQAKSEFLANMSHELRTPMHAILSFSRLGQKRSANAVDDKLRQYFERIGQSADRLLALINDLLDLSKLESGKQAFEFKPIDLMIILKSAVAHLDPLLQARQLNVDIAVGDAYPPIISGDRKRIEQLVHNLLSNAIKFSPNASTIYIQLQSGKLPRGRRTADNGQIPALTLEIRDSGPGVPEMELEAIFDKFVQSSITKTGAGGTGLGLAIAREVVHLHHGTVSARNNLDKGTTFSVTLPIQNIN